MLKKPFENLELKDMKNEVWLDVPSLENIYQISNLGRVRTKDRDVLRNGFCATLKSKIRKQKLNKHTGYLMVGLNLHGKSINYTIHSLVGEAFLGYKRGQGKGSNKNCINHKNGEKQDNRLENLEVITLKENVQHMFRKLECSTGHKITYEGKVYYSKAEFKRKNKISTNMLDKMIESGEVTVKIPKNDTTIKNKGDKIEFEGIIYNSKIEMRRKLGISEKKQNKMIEAGEIKLIK